MKKFIRTTAIIVGPLTVGAIFGPILIAALAAALWPSTDRFGEPDEASKLVDAYQDRLEPGLLFLTILPPEDGAECGYRPDDVFPGGFDEMIEARRNRSYADYEGYRALDSWRSRNRDEDWIAAIATQIDEEMTPFEAGFLRRCIEATIFADMCMKRVEGYGNSLPRFDGDWERYSLAGGDEDKVVCTFVDGVAARRGIALPDRRTETR